MAMKKNEKSKNTKTRELILKRLKEEHPLIPERRAADLCQELMKVYGANVNLARYFSEARDGLKPVERRIMFDLYNELKSKPTSKKVKVARIVGDVLGKFHPHGDSSVYECIVKLGQYFNQYPCLISKQGNYGTIEGDRAAAMRYIEGGISLFAYYAFWKDVDTHILDMKKAFDNERYEPECLFAKYPVLLMKGSFGMGYGIFNGIPSFNISEIVDMFISAIDNPDKTNYNIMPDFPCPCTIVEKEKGDLKKMLQTGEGSFFVRGNLELDYVKNTITIRSIPYQTFLGNILDQINKLVVEKKIDLVDREDESEKYIDKKDGLEKIDIRIVLKAKRGADLDKITEILYKSTDLQKTFAYKFNAIYDLEPVLYSIKAFVMDWLDYERDMIQRSLTYKFKKLSADYDKHVTIVEILSDKKANNYITEISSKAQDQKELIEMIVKKFKNLNDIQADMITRFTPAQRTVASMKKYKEKYDELKDEIDKILKILKNPDKIDDIIKENLLECKRLFGRKRQTDIITLQKKEIDNTEVCVSISDKGYIRKSNLESMTLSSYKGCVLRSSDADTYYKAKADDCLTILRDDGRGCKFDLSEMEYTTEGALGIKPECLENYKCVGVVNKSETEGFVVSITEQGYLSKIDAATVKTKLHIPLKLVLLRQSDALARSLYLKTDGTLLVTGVRGTFICLQSIAFQKQARNGKGSIALKLRDEDKVDNMFVIDESKKYIVITTSYGNMKKYKIKDIEKSKRGDKMKSLIRLKPKEKIIDISSCNDNELLRFITTEKMVEIKVKDVEIKNLISSGVQMIKRKGNESVISRI